jgi:hypothetical protein
VFISARTAVVTSITDNPGFRRENSLVRPHNSLPKAKKQMVDKLRVTNDGKVYVDGVLRLIGPPGSVLGNGDMQAHLLRLESEVLSPIDRIVHESVMKAYGFQRDREGVWRQIT